MFNYFSHNNNYLLWFHDTFFFEYFLERALQPQVELWIEVPIAGSSYVALYIHMYVI